MMGPCNTNFLGFPGWKAPTQVQNDGIFTDLAPEMPRDAGGAPVSRGPQKDDPVLREQLLSGVSR